MWFRGLDPNVIRVEGLSGFNRGIGEFEEFSGDSDDDFFTCFPIGFESLCEAPELGVVTHGRHGR